MVTLREYVSLSVFGDKNSTHKEELGKFGSETPMVVDVVH